jgi:cytosine/creatinine deaminase
VATTGLIVRNARVHPTLGQPVEPVDVSVEGDRIAAIRPAGSVPADGRRELDAEGCLVSPPLVDPHVHMDAVLTVGEPRHNESGTLIEGILTWAERKPFLTHDDVKTRAREAILWEVAQGTGLIRSHVDVCDPSLTALRALIELREEMRDLVELKLIAFPQDGILSFPNGKELMREAMRLGCDVIGGIPHYEWTREDGVEGSISCSILPARPARRSTSTAMRPTTSTAASWRSSRPGRCAMACKAGSSPATPPRWAPTTTPTPSSCSRS